MQDMQIKKAVFYGRVSTQNDEQSSSIENQIKLAEKYLKDHPEIAIVEKLDTYIERVSGKSDVRKKFMEMMVRISHGDIDYLMVKDLKRLSRSTEVSAQLKNACKRYGFKLILLESGRVYDPNDENNRMIYGFEALVAEELVYRQSTYGRIAHEQKMAERRLNPNNETFGFRWDYTVNDMVINEDEARIKREVFDSFVFQNKGTLEIKNDLMKMGIDVTVRTIRNWIKDTANIGKFAMNKVGSELGVGSGVKTKRFKKPEEEWVFVERPDLAIIDKDIYDLAQKIMIQRRNYFKTDKNTKVQGRFRGSHLFAAKVFCAECGCSYVHYWCNSSKTIAAYKDSHIVKRNISNPICENKEYNRIYESVLEEIALSAINGYISENQSCFELLEKIIDKAMNDANVLKNSPKDIAIKELSKLRKEEEKVLEQYIKAEGAIKLALSDRYEKLHQKELELQKIVDLNSADDKNNIADRIKQVRDRMKGLRKIEKLDRYIVQCMINRIEINKDGRINVILNTSGFYQYLVTPWGDKKQTFQSASMLYGHIKYCYNVETYTAAISKVEVLDCILDNNLIPLFTYVLPILNNTVKSKSLSGYMKNEEFIILISVYVLL